MIGTALFGYAMISIYVGANGYVSLLSSILSFS